MTVDDLQQRVDAATAIGGDIVKFNPAEITSWDKTLWLKSNVHLLSEDPTFLIEGTIGDFRLIATTLSGTTKDVYRNIRVEGVRLKSNFGSGIVINNTNNVVLKDNEVCFGNTTVIRQAVYLQHCKSVSIHGNYVHDYPGNGISVTATDDFEISGNNVVGNSVSDDGIDVDYDFLSTSSIASNNGRVVNNTVSSIRKGNGIRIENSHNVLVYKNSVDDVTTVGGIAGGILANASTSNTASGIHIIKNVVSNCISGGILADGPGLTGTVIYKNEVTNCAYNGGTNPRAGLLLGAPEVECVLNAVSGALISTLDGAALLVYKYAGHRIFDNALSNSYAGIRRWSSSNYDYSTINEHSTTYIDNTHNFI